MADKTLTLDELGMVGFQGGQEPIKVTTVEDSETFDKATEEKLPLYKQLQGEKPKRKWHEPIKLSDLEGLEIKDTGPGSTFDVGVRFGQEGDFIRSVESPIHPEVTGIRRKPNETVEEWMRRQEQFDAVQRQKEHIQRGQVRQARRGGPDQTRDLGRAIGTIVEKMTGQPILKLADLASLPLNAIGEGIGGSLTSAVIGLREDPLAAVIGGFSQVLTNQIKDPAVRQAVGEKFAEWSGVMRPEIKGALDRIGLGGDLDPGVIPGLTAEQAQTYTAKVFQAVGSSIPQAVMSAMPLGQGLSLAFGALQGTGSAFMDAKQAGATDEEARVAGRFGALLGMVDAIGGPESGSFLKPGLGGTVRHILREGWHEGLTEGFQSIGEDLNAALIAGYDPKRSIGARALDDAVLGAIVGGGFAGTIGAIASTPSLPSAFRERIEPIFDSNLYKGLFSEKSIEQIQNGTAFALSDWTGGEPLAPKTLDPARIRIDETEGSLPALIAPDQLFEKIGLSNIRGMNLDIDKVPDLIRYVEIKAPEVATVIDQHISQLVQKSVEQGMGSIVLLNEDLAVDATRQHEQLHAGQTATLAERDVEGKTGIERLTSDGFEMHPLVVQASRSRMGSSVLVPPAGRRGGFKMLAAELPAYIAEGRAQEFGLSTGEAIDYVLDYLDEVVKGHGVEGLDILTRISRQQQGMLETFNITRSKYGLEELTDRPASGTERGGAVEGTANEGGPSPGTYSSRPTAGGPVGGTISFYASEDVPTGSESRNETTIGGITDQILSSRFEKEISRAFSDLLEGGTIEIVPNVPLFTQVTKAVAEGKLESSMIDRAISQYGVTVQELADEFEAAATRHGQGLQYLSQIEKEWRRIYEENPKLAQSLLPAGKLARYILDDLAATRVGRSVWQRGGDAMRKAALSDISIASYNVLTTLSRLPIEAMTAATTGLGMGLINPKKYGGKSWTALGEAGRASMMRELKPIADVLAMAKPSEIRRMNWRGSLEGQALKQEHQDLLHELRVAYPELEHKLRGLSSGLEASGKKVGDILDVLEQSINRMGDVKAREQLRTQMDTYRGRQKMNESIVGRTAVGIESALDVLMLPNQIQELAFRAPFFAGALRAEAEKVGHDLNDLIARKSLDALPREVVERAIDRALEFTYAYDPKKSGGAIESGAASLIEGLNKWGPVGFAIEAFPRALYNGLKFMYEYGPLGALVPGTNVLIDLTRGRNDEWGRPLKGREAVQEKDIRRLSQAMVGLALYGAAYGLRESVGGEEWWQIKTGKKDSKGKTIYFDARRFMPMAGYMWVIDHIDRLAQGRDIDKSAKEWGELYFGMRRSDQGLGGTFEAIDALEDFLGGRETKAAGERASEAAGRFVGLATRPFINLRELWGQFRDAERERKDLRGEGLWGPSLDNLPWVRESLPAATSLTETGPQPTSLAPGARMLGARFESSGYATRELARLGIQPSRWLRHDPDPEVDRAARRAFGTGMEKLGQQLERNPSYQSASDSRKQQMWDFIVNEPMFEVEGGDGETREVSLPRFAAAMGLEANPAVKVMRETKEEIGLPPIVEEKSGLNKKLNEKLKEQKGKGK